MCIIPICLKKHREKYLISPVYRRKKNFGQNEYLQFGLDGKDEYRYW